MVERIIYAEGVRDGAAMMKEKILELVSAEAAKCEEAARHFEQPSLESWLTERYENLKQKIAKVVVSASL